MERRFYEYRGMRGGEHYERMEANPMIGYRGCFRNVAESDLFFKLFYKVVNIAYFAF